MSKEITRYEKEVMDRIDEIRENQGHSMEDFSEYIGVELETYKRCKYKKIRVDLNMLHAVVSKYPGDLEYILFGKKGQNYKLINTFISGSDEDRAQMFDELARYYRIEKEMKNNNSERLRKRAIEKYDVEYVTKAGVVETAKRRSSSAGAEKMAKEVAKRSGGRKKK